MAIVVGFRWSASWALMFITKVTPFVGVLWFAVRREWRAFAFAIGVTAAIVAVSFALDRAAWEQWIAILRADLTTGAGQGTLDTPGWYLAVPLLPRLVAAAALVVVAALTDRRWLVPFAVVLALPVIWLNGLAVLAAVVPLWQARTVARGARRPRRRREGRRHDRRCRGRPGAGRIAAARSPTAASRSPPV